MTGHSNPTIEIVKESNKIREVKIVMPVWVSIDSDNVLQAKMPLLGIATYGSNEEDLSVAIKEAIACFCMGAEKFGIGLEEELQFNKWIKVQDNSSNSIFIMQTEDDTLVEDLMDTGDETAYTVDFPNNELICA